MIFAYSCRNLKISIVNKDLFSNKYMNKSMIILGLIQILVFITPIKSIFKIVNINLFQIIYCLIVVILIFLIDELSKNIIIKVFKD